MGRHYVMQSRILELLALHRLGKSAEASKAYEEATKIAHEIYPDAPLYLNSAGYNDDWIEWVLYEPLHQEAKRQRHFPPLCPCSNWPGVRPPASGRRSRRPNRSPGTEWNRGIC